MQVVQKYFPDLTVRQQQQFLQLNDLYHDWNSKINVISRKDIDNLYEHHVLHSLAIAKLIRFKDNTKIMDAGTGGGFPGIPLAILFPQCRFVLVDSIGKKIMVCEEIAKAVGLQNIICIKSRVEGIRETFDFVVSRAVMDLKDLLSIVRKNIQKKQQNALPNGLIYLTGGEVDLENTPYKKRIVVTNVRDFFVEEYFQTKKLVYVNLC